jgi:hypothetical protein
MKTTTEKKFDAVEFFLSIKAKLANRMENMTLKEQKEFLRKVRDGEIKIQNQKQKRLYLVRD